MKQLKADQRAALTVWLAKNEKELCVLNIDPLREKAQEALGFEITYHSMQRMREALKWPKLIAPSKTKIDQIVRVHLDDWEQRLKALEDRVTMLEELTVG